MSQTRQSINARVYTRMLSQVAQSSTTAAQHRPRRAPLPAVRRRQRRNSSLTARVRSRVIAHDVAPQARDGVRGGVQHHRDAAAVPAPRFCICICICICISRNSLATPPRNTRMQNPSAALTSRTRPGTPRGTRRTMHAPRRRRPPRPRPRARATRRHPGGAAPPRASPAPAPARARAAFDDGEPRRRRRPTSTSGAHGRPSSVSNGCACDASPSRSSMSVQQRRDES